MPSGTPSRSDDALRDLESRTDDNASTLVALASHINANELLYDSADRRLSRHKHPAFRVAHDQSYRALCDTQFALLHVVPESDDRDLMILAGFASMLGDQLPDIVGPDDKDGAKLCEGIKAALVAISAAIAQTKSAGPEVIAAIYPELARSIRRDMMIVAALRADAEAC
tara:strand:+ start:20111 stop:20617 length:507 start_codon:yes stop_codon:yes gene_type:complete